MMKPALKGCLALAVLALCSANLFAGAGGGNDYSLTLNDAAGPPGTPQVVTTFLDSSTGGEIQGWSLGVCNNPADLNIVSATAGATTLTINLGGPPQFESINIFANGVTQGVVINFAGLDTLGPGSGYELLDITYACTTPGTVSPVDYCNTLGSPPVVTVVVVMGQSIVPAQSGANVTCTSDNSLTVGDETGVVGQPVDVDVSLTNPSLAVAAVQVAMTYDPSLVASTGADPVGPASGAEFFAIQPMGVGELAIGLVMDILAPIGDSPPIPTSAAATAIIATHWDVDAGAPAPTTANLTLANGIGMPPVNNLVVFGDGSTDSAVNLVSGSILIVNFNPFLRGDCNDDGIVNIADGVYWINALFLGGPEPTCDDACDSNDDGSLDASDAIYIWNFQFLDGPPPPPPFPAMGIDPTTGDGIGCNGDADDLP